LAALLASPFLWACKASDLRKVGAAIEVDPGAIAFGAVALGDSRQLPVKVRNTGSGLLSIARIAFEGSDQILVSGILNRDCAGGVRRDTSASLSAGECASFAVAYAPTAAGRAAGRIRIDSDDADRPAVFVDVGGEATVGSIEVCLLADDGSVGSCSTETTVPTLDFGAVAPSSTTPRKLRVRNTGAGQLLFAEQRLGNGSATDFSLLNKLGNLGAGASATLDVQFAPRSNGTKRGDVLFVTNDPRRPELSVPLLGAVAGWRLCVVPEEGLDFGLVPIGQTRSLPVALQNCGNVDLKLTSLALLPFAPTTTEFTAAGMPALPLTMAAGAEVKLDVAYAPRVERVDTASIDYSVDVSEPQLPVKDSIPIRGQGAPPVCTGTRPTAVIRTYRGNGSQFDPAAVAIEPLETVTLDGAASTFPAGSPQYAWRLVSQPPNGNQQIRGTGPRPTLWMELAGEYVVELVVRDAACQSTAATVKIRVVPNGALHVQLTWSQSYGDVDLHYVGPGGKMFQALDTSSCSGTEPCGDTYFRHLRPDWGCADRACSQTGGVWADGNARNDASLDIDQLWGNGPENTNHKLPFDGSYEVQVHYFCAHKCDYDRGICWGNPFGPATPTVKIFVDGVEKMSKTITLQEYQVWDVATVTVKAGQISLTEANVSPSVSPVGCLRH